MGTKVHCKNYLPGYYSMRDLNEESSSTYLSAFYGDKTLSNGQYYNGCLSRNLANLYPGYDKDTLKETMLQHEEIFKHQVFELHRLYKIQKDMMDEVRRKKLHKHQISMETSSSSSPVVSQMPSEEAQKWHKPSFPLVKSFSARPSVSGAEIINSPLSCTEGNSAQAGRIPFQNGCSLKDSEVSESRPSKVRRKLFDLHLPADEYIDTEEGEQSLDNKASDCSSYLPSRNHKSAPGSSSKVEPDVGFPRSVSCLNSSVGLADLNEPVQLAELTTTSVDFMGCTSGQGEMKDLDLEAKPKSQFLLGLPKETLQNPGVSSNHIEIKGNDRDWLSYIYEAGPSKAHFNCSLQGLQSNKSPLASQLKFDMLDKTHQALRKSQTDQSMGDSWRGRTVCDLELSGKGHDLSRLNHLEPVVASNISNPCTSVNSDLENGWSHSIPSWGKASSSLSQKLTSIQMHLPPLNSLGSLGRSCQSSTQSHEFFGDKWHLRNSGSKPDFEGGLSNRNSCFHGSSSGSKDVPYQFPSVSFEYMNYNKDEKVASERFINYGPGSHFKGSNIVDIKSLKDMNLNTVPSKSSSNGLVPRQSLLVIDEERKCEDHLKFLPWLKANPACKNEDTSTMKDSNSSNLSFLQAASNSLCNKNETMKGSNLHSPQDIAPAPCELDAGNRRNEEDNSVVDRKILGSPIFYNSYTPKDESSSLISTSVSLRCTPRGEGTKAESKIGVIDINLACDPESSMQIEDEVLVVEKESDKKAANLRTHIDLNLCASEDEIAVVPSVASKAISLKIAFEIDLEAPALPETEDDFQPAEEQKRHVNQDETVRLAAEAIVAISSSVQETNCCYPSEDLTEEPLLWFVEVVSSYIDDTDSKFGSESRAKDVVNTETSTSDELDYFEAMTLKLAEVKEEEYMPKPLVLENSKVEETVPVSLPGRPRRGHARRGRQRRDFQRDILPGLASLSRHEVTEDLQTFGGLMRAMGHPWHSGLARRSSTRNGGGRGRRRVVPDSAPNVVASTGPTLLIQQLNNIEVGLEDRSLTGWGKTPRRPRRQRGSAAVGNPPSIPLN
ncbi:hypothetical protein NMG60_11009291 [Bertholletia excelsa]